MKIKLLISILLVCGITKAQTLKLKPGQKFSYEAINEIERINQTGSSKNYEYWKTNFVVLNHAKNTYTLRASPEIFLKKWGEDIDDSTVPFEEQPDDFMSIAKKVITNSSYELIIDDNGKITGINGIPEIKAAILVKLKELNTPEGDQKHAELTEMIITNNYLKARSSFFERTTKALERVTKSGLILSYNSDTTNNSISSQGNQTNVTNTITKFNLIEPNGKRATRPLLLMAEAKEKMSYAEYSTPIKRAIRKIKELPQQFIYEKGSQTIEAKIMKKLDLLDKNFAKDDYQYMGAKLIILTFLKSETCTSILDKVPYEYLPTENDIDNKLTRELAMGNLSNVKKAVELSFTKFKGELYYPRNMVNTSSSIHDSFGGLIYRLQNKDSLQSAYTIIKELEHLQIPILTEMLKGMKTYLQAKLATGQSELAEIANTHFNSTFDKPGRYRILIYDELVKKHAPDSLKLAYIDYTVELGKKKLDQINSGSIEHLDPSTLEDYIFENRIVYKKHLADAYYRKSKLQKSTEQSFLQLAADYLPTQQDIVDNQNSLEVEYKFAPFIPYTELYLASGINSGTNDEARLNRYVDMVILEPERYAILKENYAKAYPKGDFKVFFSTALKSKLPAVPKFSLNERSGSVVSNKDQQNKFVFVDFWGTWCEPCVAEIHKVDEIHLNNPNPGKLLVTTIACYDKKKNIDDFMAKEKYTFQVLMSDGQAQKDFKIRSYPTKLLFLPNGVYLAIPFNSDYNDILNKYLKWEI
ncbi:thiol-disulfide isomerase/thioredoxin [Pedobacter sp. UYP24]